MVFSLGFSGLAAAVLSFTSLSQALEFTASNNVAVYWGQNSYGQSSGNFVQKRLADYCGNTFIDIIPIAFVMQMTSGEGGQPVIGLANQQGACTRFEGTGLLHCPQVAEDIKICQSKYNKTIILSLGGGTYNEGGFANISSASLSARKLWFTFGPNVNPAYLRPFDDAVVDGFDLDFEMPTTFLQPFAWRLRTFMNAYTVKPMYLTVAPQCPYPDVATDSVLSAVPVDAVFVQFYNNYCGLQSFNYNATQQTDFNFARWDQWAKETAPQKNVKVFLGVPAGEKAGAGYQGLSRLQPILKYCKQFSSFGGVMMWDMSQAVANYGFVQGVKYMIQPSTNSTSNSTSSTTSSSTTSTSKSTSQSTTLKTTTGQSVTSQSTTLKTTTGKSVTSQSITLKTTTGQSATSQSTTSRSTSSSVKKAT